MISMCLFVVIIKDTNLNELYIFSNFALFNLKMNFDEVSIKWLKKCGFSFNVDLQRFVCYMNINSFTQNIRKMQRNRKKILIK